MGKARNIREHLEVLQQNDKLFRIDEGINKDTELMPMVRWQFRGLEEKQRRAFLFENIYDVKGRKYDIPVLVAAMAASKEVYALGLGCNVEDIHQEWDYALSKPVEPVVVQDGPCQEEVHLGEDLNRPGEGLAEFPIPISTPGFDNAPYITAGHFVTKDPETGIRNIGNYRAQVKSQTRTGIALPPAQHMAIHWQKCKRMGIPLEAAIVIGCPPSVSYAAVSKVPYGTDEYAVAGGLDRRPMELVKCKTIDIEVPAQAEIVIEGKVSTEYLEEEAPFGEYCGYVGPKGWTVFFDITCITHRRNPIYTAFISQFPPSESSKIRQISMEQIVKKYLKDHCNIPGIKDVAFHEVGGSWQYCVISLDNLHPAHAWQALHGALARDSMVCKIVIAVDSDIDPHDADSVNWALSFRMQPHRDVQIVRGRATNLDYSAYPPDAFGREAEYPDYMGSGAMLINATRKWGYPPVALPRKEFMEKAKELWEKAGLPELSPKTPWFGYELGYWTDEEREEAELALKGEHFKTGEKLLANRKKSSL